MHLSGFIVATLALIVSQPLHADAFSKFWVCGKVYDSSGIPFAGQNVIVVHRPNGSADPRYTQLNLIPGSVTTTDETGRYKVGVETYGDYGINSSFFLAVADATRQAVLSPRFTVEMERRDPFMDLENPNRHYIYPAVASASAGIHEATVVYDLHCQPLVDVKVLVRREDGGELGEVGGTISLGPEGQGILYLLGGVYSRFLTNAASIDGPTAEIMIHGILPGTIHDVVYSASGGFGDLIETHEFNKDGTVELNIPADHYRKIYCRVIDQNNKPITDMQVDLVYMRPWCYSFCSEHDLYIPDEEGRVVLEWGSKDFLDILVIFEMGHPVPPESYEYGDETTVYDDNGAPMNTSREHPLIIRVDREKALQGKQ